MPVVSKIASENDLYLVTLLFIVTANKFYRNNISPCPSYLKYKFMKKLTHQSFVRIYCFLLPTGIPTTSYSPRLRYLNLHEAPISLEVIFYLTLWYNLANAAVIMPCSL